MTVLAGVVTITDEAIAAPAAVLVPSMPSNPGSDAVLMLTSGTTARPKVVRVTQANIQANTLSILAYLGLRSDDRILVVLPFYYCYGASLLHTHLRAGARLVLCNSMAFPGKVIDLMTEQECTGFAGVPSSYQLLLRASTFGSRPLPALRILQQAGGKLSSVLVEEVLAAQPNARLFVMYGQTEATARLSYLPPERLPDKLGSIGRGIPGVELRVLDEEGRPVRPGERGEIYARGANVCAGYLDDPAGTATKFTPDGLRTGDLAVVDEEGFIYRRRPGGRLHQVLGTPDLQPGDRGMCAADVGAGLRGRSRRRRRQGRRGDHAVRRPGSDRPGPAGGCGWPSAAANWPSTSGRRR